MQRKDTQADICRKIYRHTRGNLRFISGKWFIGSKELKNIQKWIVCKNFCDNIYELNNVIEMYKIMYGTSGKWFDLPIVSEAQELINQNKLKKLCYPLSLKQLKIINYLIRHDEEVFFILTGVGGSGKSTFANIICQIFDNDTASLSLSDLSNDFLLASGIDKRLIYSTEINSDDINNGNLKRLFSNEELTINPKHQQPFKARCQSAFFFNCNKNPRLDLCDTGMLRRILYYDMNVKIKNPDPTLNKMVWTHDALVNIVAHALQVDMTNWKDDFKDETRLNLVKDNSVYRFRTAKNYREYETACLNDRLKPFSKPNWENIRDLLDEWGMLEPVEFTKLNDKQIDVSDIF